MIMEQRQDKTKITYPYIVNNDANLKEFTSTSIKLKEIGVRYIALLEPDKEVTNELCNSGVEININW